MADDVRKRLAGLFNRWARDAAENPEKFQDAFTKDGSPEEMYGEVCAEYFLKLAADPESGLLLSIPTACLPS